MQADIENRAGSRRRGDDRLPAGVPGPGDQLRQSRRQGQRGPQAAVEQSAITRCLASRARDRARPISPVSRRRVAMASRVRPASARRVAARHHDRGRARPAADAGAGAVADRAHSQPRAAVALPGVDHLSVRARRRHLGPQHPGQLGLRDPPLRLVAWARACRDPDLGDAAADGPGLAQQPQPLRRGDDGLRGDLRGHGADHPPRPAVVPLLDVPLPRDDGACGRSSEARSNGTCGR